MSDKEIRNFLRQLNNVPEQQGISYAHLSGPVFRAAVVTEMERSMEERGGPKMEPHAFYFIRTGDGRFVGAVHDAVHDLHWYVVHTYRGQGLMSSALRDVILPHIAATGRTVQPITISRGIGGRKFAASQHLATAVGFRLVSDAEGQVLLYEMDFAVRPVPDAAPVAP